MRTFIRICCERHPEFSKTLKAFLREAMTEMKALAKNSEKKEGTASKSKKPAEWQVTVDGDTATAVNIAVESDKSSPLGMAQTMELIKVGDTWKISSIIPDRVIIEMQQGMTATSSTSNPSDNSDGRAAVGFRVVSRTC